MIKDQSIDLNIFSTESYLRSTNPGSTVSQKLLNHTAMHCTFNIFKEIIMRTDQYLINEDLLEHACRSDIDRYSKIKLLLNNKVTPTKKIFDTIVSTVDDDNIFKTARMNSVILMNASHRVDYIDAKNNRKNNRGWWYIDNENDSDSENDSDGENDIDGENDSNSNSDNNNGIDSLSNSDNDTSEIEEKILDLDVELSSLTEGCQNNQSTEKDESDDIIMTDSQGRRHYINPKLHQQNPSFAIHLLTKYAYDITYDDVKHALKRGIIIHNLGRFNIVFDVTYLHICSEIGIKPPYDTCNTSHLKPDIICLINECKHNNFFVIRSMIDNYGIVPNTTCLHEVCRSCDNIVHTVKLLVSKGAKADFECVEIIISRSKHNIINEAILKEIKKKYLEDNVINFNYFSRITYLKSNATAQLIFSEFKKNYMKDKNNDFKSKNNNIQDPTLGPKLSPGTPLIVTDPDIKEIDKKLQYIIASKIPLEMNAYDSIYNRIPLNICKLLGLTFEKNRSINYVDFRILMINHLKNSGLIAENKIRLKKPFLYGGARIVRFEEINEWAYSILSKNQNCKNNKN